jgi:aminoglycoside 3-N-acetyltransferase
MRGGEAVRVEYEEIDHCCANFARVDGWLRERRLQAEGGVGRGIARLVRAHDLVRVAVEHLRADPFAFLHARGSGCDECDDAWVSCA